MFTFIIKKRKQPKRASTNKWVNKMSYSHNKRLFGSKREQSIYIHATVRMNLENIILK